MGGQSGQGWLGRGATGNWPAGPAPNRGWGPIWGRANWRRGWPEGEATGGWPSDWTTDGGWGENWGRGWPGGGPQEVDHLVPPLMGVGELIGRGAAGG